MHGISKGNRRGISHNYAFTVVSTQAEISSAWNKAQFFYSIRVVKIEQFVFFGEVREGPSNVQGYLSTPLKAAFLDSSQINLFWLFSLMAAILFPKTRMQDLKTPTFVLYFGTKKS